MDPRTYYVTGRLERGWLSTRTLGVNDQPPGIQYLTGQQIAVPSKKALFLELSMMISLVYVMILVPRMLKDDIICFRDK